jgi:hypothetical protein
MQMLLIEPTKSTPRVEFDKSSQIYRITGQSYPENALLFFTPVFQWLDDFLGNMTGEAEFQFGLQYMNTSSSKCIMDIIDMLDSAYARGKKVAIKWLYDADNENLLECAEEFKEDVSLPFVIVPVEG